MEYLLDTSAVIALLNGSSSAVANQARLHKPADIGVSAIVSNELYFGALKSRRISHNVNLIDGLRLEVLDFHREDARHAAEIRAFLAIKGMTIGLYDVLIAGQARSRGLILITHNVREFRRVPNLRIEDWESIRPRK